MGLRFTIFDDPRQIERWATTADDSPVIDSIWVRETWPFDAFSCLAYASSLTKKVKLAAGIVNVFSRSPSLIAISTATLNLLSTGRAVLGLGISGKSVIEDWHSMRFEKPIQHMRKYVSVIRKIMRGEKMNHSGPLLSVKRFKIALSPPENDIQFPLQRLARECLTYATKLLTEHWCAFIQSKV